MLMMRMESAVRELVEVMLPRFSGNLGVEMTLDLSWSRYSHDGENDKSFRREVRLLFLRECNYTKVFSRVTDLGGPRQVPGEIDKWKLIGDHDSEWMSGVEQLFRNMEREVWDWDAVQSPGQTVGLSEHFGFSIFSRPRYLQVEYELAKGQDRFGSECDVMILRVLNRLEAAMKMKATLR